MKTKSAFTIVELLVVVTIITVLAAVSILAYNGAQKDARDTTRKGNVTVISEALEKYYDKNGEYPSVVSLVSNNGVTGQAVADKLNITLDDLKMPRLPSGVTNPLTSTTPPTNDNIAYIASSGVSDARCKTDANSGCDQFTLQYVSESGGTITIESRHRNRAGSTQTTSDEPIDVALAVTPPNVVATASTTATCSPGTLTRKFAFTYRTIYGNDATWSGWSDASTTWSTSTTFSVTGVAGTTYEFKAFTRCDNGATAGASSVPSAVKSISYPVTPPAAPTMNLSYSGGDVFWTISAVTCDADATPEYSWRWHNSSNSYNAWSSWGTSRTWKFTPTAGYTYYWEQKSRCHTLNVDSTESVGPESSYTQPINAPAAPTVSVTPWDGTRIDWNWNDVSCPAGTFTEYQRKWSREGNPGSWAGPSTSTTYAVTTTLQGYEYNLDVQARCANAYTEGSWGATGSASTINPIATPAAPSGFNGTFAADGSSLTVTWTAPTCGAGTRAEHSGQLFGYWGSPRNEYGWPPDNDWNQPAQGYWSASYTINTSSLGSGYRLAVRKKYICVNTTSGRSGAIGTIGTSPEYVKP